MVDVFFEDDEPCYVISVVAKLVDMHPQTLRYYERVGLIKPSRTAGRIRLYSQRDIDSLRRIARITEELGVKNLAGVEVIINMNRRIEELQQQLAELQQRYTEEINAMLVKMRTLETQLKGDQSGGSLAGNAHKLIPG